jgi:hypothetical protein
MMSRSSRPSGKQGSTIRDNAKMLAVLAFGILLAFVGAFQLRAALSAAAGTGTRGYFVVKGQSCSFSSHGAKSCSWSGYFRLPDGTITRFGVGFEGSHPDFRAGTVVAALDTGDPFHVFQPHGSVRWLGPSGYIATGVLFIVATVVAMLPRRRSEGTG